MSKNEEKMHLPKITLDDFLSSQEERDNAKLEKVQMIPLDKITDFPNHPYRVVEDDEMFNMAESVKKWGVIHPVIVRPKEDGTYEMISGHRRKRASEIAGRNEIKAIVREMTDEEAIITMVDSNKQREKVLPSEKAFAYKMKLEAMKRQGGKIVSMEIKVNKEIRDYTESIFFGLSMRQFIFSLLACVVAIGLYFIFKKYLGTEMLSWVCILGAVPFAILGFLKYNGMYAEEFIVAWIKSEILTPRILFFQSENIYYELLRDEYNNKEMEELKSEIVKKGQRKSKNPKKCATSNTHKSNIRRWHISSGKK